MNDRASRLEPLAGYASQVEAEAARRLAASVKNLKSKETELEQLRSYLAEYRQREEQELQTSESGRWRNTRLFLAKLCDAVAFHEAELQKAVERYRFDADRWRDCHQRTQTLDKVVERSNRDASHTRQQREQAELDEQAARRSRESY